MKLTKAEYLQMKGEYLTDSFIKYKYKLDQNQLYDLKKRWGVVNKLPKVNQKVDMETEVRKIG